MAVTLHDLFVLGWGGFGAVWFEESGVYMHVPPPFWGTVTDRRPPEWLERAQAQGRMPQRPEPLPKEALRPGPLIPHPLFPVQVSERQLTEAIEEHSRDHAEWP